MYNYFCDNVLETAGDRISGIASNVNVTSNASPDVRIAAVFGRFNFSFDNAIFVNGSIRREGSTKLGENNRYGIFPALGLGVDLNHYLQIGSVDVLKLRVGYGVTGSLPRESGLAQDLYAYSFNGGGNVTKTRDANLELKWEQKAEINAGIDFGLGGKVTGSLDVYTRNIKDFILERNVDVTVFPSGRRFENAGSLKTNGIELAVKYTSLNLGQAKWTPGLVLSSYQTTLESFIIEQQMRADLGAPGQNGTNMIRVAVGEKIGQIWGPVFTGVNESNGTPVFADLNGDGTVVSAQGSALLPDGDFKELGHGLPTLEAGWTNDAKFGNWELNFFFRGAFGHSLVNSFRAFYEPIDPGAINSYNRFKSDKAVPGLTSAQFSSLYVEKANFVKLDNITLTYNIPTTGMIKNLKLYASVQNAFVISKYTGIDPEPALQDMGAIDNGGYLSTNADGSLRQADVLSPGIDRRNNYFTARTLTFGFNIGF